MKQTTEESILDFLQNKIRLETAADLQAIASKYNPSKLSQEQYRIADEVWSKLMYAAKHGCTVINNKEPLPEIVCRLLKENGFDVKDNGLAIYFDAKT